MHNTNKIITAHIINRDKIYIRFITYYFLSMMSYTLIKRLLGNGTMGTIVAAGISFPILAILAFPVFILLIRTKLPQMIITISLFTLIYLISAFREVSFEWLIPYYTAGIFGIFLGFTIYSVNDLNAFYKKMLSMSKWLLLIGIFIIFTDRSLVKYSLFYSYLLSIALYFHTNEFLNYKIIYLPCILLELFLILFFGSRGPILCYSIFLCAKIYFKTINPIPKIALASTAILLVNKYQEIGEWINNLFLHFNIYSRSLYLFFNRFEYVSGRDIVQEICKELISVHPFLGWGVCGGYDILEGYPHNIILEMMLNFGIFLGTALFIILVLTIFYTFVKSKGLHNTLFLIFISYGFVTLFVSASYLTWSGFYLMLGLMFNLIHRYKYNTGY